jgi:flagellar hook-associated protein 2
VGQDSSGTTANVQSFVDGWNKLVNVLATLTSHGDSTDSSSTPGTFASDSGVTALQTRMQAILRQQLGGTSLVSFGITAQRDGTLTLNSTRLAKQLTLDPTGLDTLMGKASLTTPSGVMGDLDKLMTQWTNSTGGQIATRRENNTKLQTTLTTKQERITDNYNSAYDRYLKQFTALQTLQTQMNGNSSLFDALFGTNSDS